MKQRLTPDQVRALFEQKRWRQELFALTREITVHQNRRCMCIPSREDAKEEARKLEQRHRGQISNVRITKNGKGPTGTYTVAYTLTETKTEQLF